MTDLHPPAWHPLADRLAALSLRGMAAALSEQLARTDLAGLSFEDRLALLIDREAAERQSRALQRRLKKAQLRQSDACFEDIDMSHPRGLDRSLMLGLADCAWVRDGVNILITGPTGTGKSWLAQALAHKACLEGFQALYRRMPTLIHDLRVATGEGAIGKLYREFERADVLVLDDWGLTTLDPPRRHDILEILDHRTGRRPVIVTSQLPVRDWHDQIGDPTLADAVLDRLIHHACRIELTGRSMRARTKRRR